MFRASQEQLQSLLITAEKLSHHYAKKYPDIEWKEFYSISQVAITKALQRYNPRKGKLLPRVKIFIYEKFNKYINQTQVKPPCPIPKDTQEAEIIVKKILHTIRLTDKQKSAVLYYLQYKEPPKENRHAFYNAVKKIRRIYTKSPFLENLIVEVDEK